MENIVYLVWVFMFWDCMFKHTHMYVVEVHR